MKNSVAIIDFGTSKITVLIGSRGINSTINIDGIGICDYAGFAGGKLLNPEEFGFAVSQAIATAETSARLKINKLYVGVPGDFLRCEVNDVSMALGKKRRVTESDIDDLHAQGNLYFADEESTVINIQPIYYTLDDERKMIAPVGMTSTRLGGSISYILADNSFIRTVDAVVANAGVSETEYVATPLAETLFLFDDYKRDNCTLLADVGALGTTLSVGRGDGICRIYHFPWGGKNITAALSDALNIPMQEAERLKRKVVLSLDPGYEMSENERGILKKEYVIEDKNETREYPVAMTNAVVENEIERFSKYVKKTFSVCDYEFPEFTPLSVTGGGLVHIRGAVQCLSRSLDRDVDPLKPVQPLLDRPQLSSALGLMDMVLNGEMPYTGFVGKIRRWLSRR